MLPTEALRKVSIFEDLEESLLRLLTVRSREKTFAAGERLMAQGEEGTSLCVLLEGRVRVEQRAPSGQVFQLAERAAGECFGEMSLIDSGGRSADVIALTDCKVLVVNQDTFEQLVLGHPRSALAMMRTLVRRLRDQSQKMAEAASQSPAAEG